MHPLLVFLVGCLVLVIVTVIVMAVVNIVCKKMEIDADVTRILKMIIGLVGLLVLIALLLQLFGIDIGLGFGNQVRVIR